MSFQYTYIGGRAAQHSVSVVVVVVAAVYCRLSEEWVLFHNKGQKNRWSSYIVRYCNIRPSQIKESGEKRHKFDQEMAIVEPYVY